jgi:acetylornithine deacetylase
MDWNAERTKANMLATFNDGPGGIVLSGHVDVVPVDGQTWTSDPFTATLRDGRIHGRGACDMKGFDAVVISQAARYAAADLTQPIHVAFTYDEELGCIGIPHLIAALDRWNIHPTGCIVGEPTSMRLVAEHKGGIAHRCEVTGCAAHSSLTNRGVNAIEYAARIITRIQALAERERLTGLRVDGFDVPYTTLSTNLFTGGNAPNIVPDRAEFTFEYRYVPGFDRDSVMRELQELAADLTATMRQTDPATGIAFTLINAIPALEAMPDSLVTRLALDILDDKTVEKVAYGTEASFFQAYGVPSIVCGPGSIQQAHRPDEYVSLDQIERCERFIAAMVAKLSAAR